ncbi:putative O-methyltransferase [Xylariales sp. PMI_506]|nr:putative O-methyltransferase [Xylariales sp. PMI_506]
MSTLDILKELQGLVEREAQGDKLAHVQLLSGVQKLQNAITSPIEKMTRMRLQVFQNISVRLAQEHGILQALVAGSRMTAEQLSKTTGVDAPHIVRIMRLVTYIGLADEVGPCEYAANETTPFSVQKGFLGDVKFYTDVVMKIGSNMGPIAKQGLDVDPSTYTFGKPMFGYLSEQREYGEAFDDFMTARKAAAGWSRWFETFPARDKIDPAGIRDVLLVDVAGGQGHWTQEFRNKHRDLPGRLIVQDQPHVIVPLEGIESMVYDFFTPQPVIGARFYYFKQIIHNWHDEKAIQILKNTAAAMEDGHSTLLIDDYVLPEEKVGFRAASMDIAMMVIVNGVERTASQWESLVGSAGLKLVKIWYAEETSEGSEAVIECEKA